METIYTAELSDEGDYHRARVGARAGAEHLGLTVYELAPGQGMHFHYHLQRDRDERRFGALFDLADAVSGYGGGEPTPHQ